MHLIEAFENKIVHSLKLLNDVLTKLFIVTNSFELMNIQKFRSTMNILKSFECRFVTKEVQQSCYQKMVLLANDDSTNILALCSLLQHCTELEIADEKLTEQCTKRVLQSPFSYFLNCGILFNNVILSQRATLP